MYGVLRCPQIERSRKKKQIITMKYLNIFELL